MELPVVYFLKNDKNIYAYDSERRLKSASISLLHLSKDSVLIDSLGSFYNIKQAYKTGWRYLWGYHPFEKSKKAKIDFEIGSTKKISLYEFKNIITEKLDRGVGRSFWYTKKNIPRLKERVIKAETYKEIIEIFLYDED